MNAIILAAGLGSRLLPMTRKIPKPLINIGGQSIIERQIAFLKELHIHNIYIVVGYAAHLFSSLEKKYGVHLIYNPYHKAYNNFYSLFLAREFFGDSYVIEGDVFMNRNFLQSTLPRSTYFTGIMYEDYGKEWILDFDGDKLKSIILPDDQKLPEYDGAFKNGAYVMTGISYWNKTDAGFILEKLKEIVRRISDTDDSKFTGLFWDDIVRTTLGNFDIAICKIRDDDWIEVDSPADLERLSSVITIAENAKTPT